MSLASFFAAIGHWFKKSADALEALFKKVEPYMEEAQQIVTALNAELGNYEALTGQQLNPKIQTFLTKFGVVDAAAESFLKANDNVPPDVLLRNAAKLALTSSNNNVKLVGNELNFVIEAALQVANTAKA